MSAVILTRPWQELLLRLLELDTQSPLEVGLPSQVPQVQTILARWAVERGLEVVHHAPPREASLLGDSVPLNVRELATAMGARFAACQPNLVLRAGRPQPPERTLVWNFHVDTVAGLIPPRLADGCFFGRGAVDAKGPAVAVLAGIDRALVERPRLLDDVQILIHSVAGEEGGAMGVYGTRELIDLGYVGRLNVFAEPSGGVYFDRATSSMTVRIEVNGAGATDDAPGAGDNATLILAVLAHRLASLLAPAVSSCGSRMCLAGIHTGELHNRVYGSGRLHLNFAYADSLAASRIERAVEDCFAAAMLELEAEFGNAPFFSRSAANAHGITRSRWLKRGIPALCNRDPEMEAILALAELERCPSEDVDRAFTCDAVWAQGPGRYTIVFGPGDLVTNGAHAESEHVALTDLETYANRVAMLVNAFADRCRSSS